MSMKLLRLCSARAATAGAYAAIGKDATSRLSYLERGATLARAKR